MTQGFKYSILASGSSGNVTYIETPERKILVDAGLSGKKIEGLMNDIGRSLADVDSLLVTHEHKDHVAGLGVLARKYKMALYANQETWQAIGEGCGKIDNAQKNTFEMGKLLTQIIIQNIWIKRKEVYKRQKFPHHQKS